MAAVEEQLLAACSPRQRAYVLDPASRYTARVGRGGGKTTGIRVRLSRKALRIRRAKLLYIAFTRPQAEDLLWEPLKELNEKLGIPCDYSESKMTCRYRQTRSTIQLVGADDKKSIEPLRGRPFHEVDIDECGSFKPKLLAHLVEQILGPRLGDYRGVLGLHGTPGLWLNGLWYDASRSGSDIARPFGHVLAPGEQEVEWSQHRWTLEDQIAAGVPAAINLWEIALKTKRLKGWTDQNPIWRREYLAEWCADDTTMIYSWRPHTEEGRPWNEWDPPRDHRGWGILPPGRTDWMYGFGMDMGHRMPFALTVLAWSPSDPDRNIYEVFEFNARGMYARTIAQLLLGEAHDHRAPQGVIGVCGWPAFMVFDIANLGEAVLTELRNVYGINAKAAPRNRGDKHAGIELMNGDLIEGRFHALKGGKLAEQLAGLQYMVDENGQPKDPKHGDDQADSAMYARREIAAMFSERAPAGPVLEPRIDAIAAGEERANRSQQTDELLWDGNYEAEQWQDWA